MVITTDVDERPRPDAHFIIPNLNFSILETFTMCGRFNIVSRSSTFEALIYNVIMMSIKNQS